MEDGVAEEGGGCLLVAHGKMIYHRRRKRAGESIWLGWCTWGEEGRNAGETTNLDGTTLFYTEGKAGKVLGVFCSVTHS
jgi:hypothetical protein